MNVMLLTQYTFQDWYNNNMVCAYTFIVICSVQPTGIYCGIIDITTKELPSCSGADRKVKHSTNG